MMVPPVNREKELNICLVAHYAYRALTNRGSGHIGGVERQVSLMARWLVRHGHDVSVVVWNEGQAPDVLVDGVRILSVCRRDAGIRGLRFFVPRWSSLLRALARADAELYYHNCAEYVTGQVALWVRAHSRKFIYSIASDPECDPRLEILGSLRERILFRYGLTHADAVISQTEGQRRRLRQGFGVAATVLPMPCDVPGVVADAASKSGARRVLWLGRIDPVKRAEVLLAAARECPQLQFDIVGPDGGDTDYVNRIRSEATSLDNVTMHGATNFTDVWRYYQGATVLCCTSRFEGFPNTFLEAWSQGLPVVSTVDPDNVIRTRSLGATVDDPADCGTILADLLADADRLDACSGNARRYFLDNFELDRAMNRFAELFEKVVDDKQPK